jgi:hypothetical protein
MWWREATNKNPFRCGGASCVIPGCDLRALHAAYFASQQNPRNPPHRIRQLFRMPKNSPVAPCRQQSESASRARSSCLRSLSPKCFRSNGRKALHVRSGGARTPAVRVTHSYCARIRSRSRHAHAPENADAERRLLRNAPVLRERLCLCRHGKNLLSRGWNPRRRGVRWGQWQESTTSCLRSCSSVGERSQRAP